MNPDLLAYCEEQLKAGYSMEQLRAVLLERGWGVDQADDALRAARVGLLDKKVGTTDDDVKKVAEAARETEEQLAAASAGSAMGSLYAKSQADGVTEKPTVPNATEMPSAPVVSSVLVDDAVVSTKPRRTWMWVIIVLVVLVVLGSGGAVWAYFNVWLAPANVMRRVIANEINEPVESFEYEGSLDMELRVKNSASLSEIVPDSRVLGIEYSPFIPNAPVESQPEKISMGINFKGKSDTRNGQEAGEISMDFYLEEAAGLEKELKELGLDLVVPNENELAFQVRLTETGDLELGDYGIFLNRWISVNLKELREEYGDAWKEYELEQENEELTEEQTDELNAAIWESNVLVLTDTLEEEEINGQRMFHYGYELDKVAMGNLMLKIVSIIDGKPASKEQENLINKGVEEMNQPHGELWVGKQDMRLHRVLLTLDLGKPTEDYEGRMTFDVTWWGINDDVLIEIPEGATDVKAVVEELSSAMEQRMADYNATLAEEEAASNLRSFDEIVTGERDLQRVEDVVTLKVAMESYVADGGVFPVEIPTGQAASIRIGKKSGELDLEPLLVPDYLSAIPGDPKFSDDLDTFYSVYRNASGDIVVWGYGELEAEISSEGEGFDALLN